MSIDQIPHVPLVLHGCISAIVYRRLIKSKPIELQKLRRVRTLGAVYDRAYLLDYTNSARS